MWQRQTKKNHVLQVDNTMFNQEQHTDTPAKNKKNKKNQQNPGKEEDMDEEEDDM